MTHANDKKRLADSVLRERLEELGKNALIDFLIEICPREALEARIASSESQRLRDLQELVQDAVAEGVQAAENESKKNAELDLFNPIIDRVRIVFDRFNEELSKASVESPFFTLKALLILIIGVYASDPEGNVQHDNSALIEMLDHLALTALNTIAQSKLMEMDEATLTLVSEKFSDEEVGYYRDYGVFEDVELKSGPRAAEILQHFLPALGVRSSSSKKKRKTTTEASVLVDLTQD